VRNKARRWVIAALDDVAWIMPFPVLWVDSYNGSQFINAHLLRWCDAHKLTFTRSRAGKQERRLARGAEELVRGR
jgi:hypothetical protein